MSGANVGDGRRLEVVVDGLPLSTPRWCARCTGDRRGATQVDGFLAGRRPRNEDTLSSSAWRRELDWSFLLWEVGSRFSRRRVTDTFGKLWLHLFRSVGIDGASPAGHEVEGDSRSCRLCGARFFFFGRCFTSFALKKGV